MNFEDFLPHILPQMTSCPRDTALHHVRLASIEFCRRALVWKEVLDTLLADGFSTEYELALDDQVEVAKLFSVAVNGEMHTLVEQTEGRALIRDATSCPIAFTDDRKTLTVWPVPPLEATIDVEVALKPSLQAFSVDDAVFAHYADTIVNGALARLFKMRGTDWHDPASAVDCSVTFDRQISTAARQAARGFGRSKRRPTTKWF